MIKIINGVDHDLNFYNLDQCDQSNPRKLTLLPDQLPHTIVLKAQPLNAKLNDNQIANIDGVPVFITDYTDVDPLPAGADNSSLVVVSMLYGAAYKTKNPDYNPMDPNFRGPKLYGVRGPIGSVVDGKFVIVGCVGLQLIR